jgi:GNAT superfamily N-acetyltransferase
MAFRYGWAAPQDADALLDFLAEGFGERSFQASAARFRWLFEEHPLGFHIGVCRDGETIAGIRCHIPCTVVASGRQYRAAYGMDLIVAPPYRRKGVASGLLDLSPSRFEALVSTGQSPGMARVYERRGVAACASMYEARHVRRPVLSLRPRALARDVVAWLWRGLTAPRPLGRAQEIPVAAAAEALGLRNPAERYAPDEAGSLRLPDLVRWRYAGGVYSGYRAHSVQGPGEGEAVVVTRQDGSETLIVDLFAAHGRQGRAALAVAAASPGPVTRALVFGDRPAGELRRAGFLVLRRDGSLRVTAGDADVQSDLSRRPWRLFAGESDLDLMREPEGP